MSALGGATRAKKRKTDHTEALAKGFKFAFDAPAYLGYGLHWPISDEEAQELGKRANAVVQSLPDSGSKKVAQFFDKYIYPLVAPGALVAGLYVVTKPRVELTRQLMAENAKRESSTATGGDPATGNGSNAGVGNPDNGAHGSGRPNHEATGLRNPFDSANVGGRGPEAGTFVS